MKLHHVCLIVLLTALFAGCREEAQPAKSEGPFVGGFRVNLQEKRVEAIGRFCLKEGILDYLAVTSGGQEYESVVALKGKGSVLHQWLLAIGAMPGPTQDIIDYFKKNPTPDRKVPDRPGTALDVTVEWERDGKKFSVPATQLLFNRKVKKPQDQGHWIFTGSAFAKDPEGKGEVYMADVDRALIAVVYASSAVVNFDKDIGNPYAGEDEGYEVNTKLVPPLDTPVTLVFALAKQPETH